MFKCDLLSSQCEARRCSTKFMINYLNLTISCIDDHNCQSTWQNIEYVSRHFSIIYRHLKKIFKSTTKSIIRHSVIHTDKCENSISLFDMNVR
jgi:hypothetical protein